MSMDTLEFLGQFIVGLFALVGLPVLAYVAHTLRELVMTQRQHAQTLYGVGGANGLNSDVKTLRAVRHEYANLLLTHGLRLDDHDRRIERIEEPR